MKKTGLLAAVTAAVALSSQVSLAQGDSANEVFNMAQNNGGGDTEKCVPLVNGRNLVAANKGACASGKHSCDGQNQAGEIDAWIFTPAGICDRIKAGDFENVPAEVKEKLVSTDLSASDTMQPPSASDNNYGVVTPSAPDAVQELPPPPVPDMPPEAVQDLQTPPPSSMPETPEAVEAVADQAPAEQPGFLQGIKNWFNSLFGN